MEKYQEIERSIIKKFRKDIWANFIKAVKEYQLIQENDKIMVCISGGKDSFLLAKCIQELQRHGDVPFEAHYVCMDPGYNDYNRQFIEDNAKILNIPLEIFESDIFDIVEKQEKSPCYLCARMRRGCLYNHAEELGCNKIALGHHLDDVIETTLLSMFYGSEVKTMMPKLHSDHFKGLELIRPLYMIREEDIIAWRKYNELTFINCACRFTEGCSLVDDGMSKRKEIKELIKKMRKVNNRIDYNIFKSLDNINLDCVLGTKRHGEYKSFLEDYEEE
ncbi:MAG: tRNA 2-thiocytidine biosynthesis protein TtcA [Bacilli bacterium]|nr:tRNA 2-thiocytidine biosynthesis protein TtcA [Bacilli bacterium]